MAEEEKERSAYIDAELEEIFSPTNRHYAREKLGREPTDEELVWHFINHGGAENFAKKHGRK
jgi:hypothetical protein